MWTVYNRYFVWVGEMVQGWMGWVGWDGSGEGKGTNARQKKSQDRPVFNRSI